MTRLLSIDLDAEKVAVEEVAEGQLRNFLGGSGLGANLLWQRLPAAKTDPFSPENLLMFMVGPLTGVVPLSSRYALCGLSPLTEGWGEAFAGGIWPTELRRAGLSGIVFEGKARHPVYLYVNDDQVELRDASHVWHKDTYQVSRLLKQETDANASVAAIGLAGENLVRMACVISDGEIGRAAARMGLGAVMGSKNLKAVVVRGARKPAVADAARLKVISHEVLAALKELKDNFLRPEQGGVARFTAYFSRIGNLPVRNHSGTRFDSFIEMLKTSYHNGKAWNCRLCPIGCLESSLGDDGCRHVVGEAFMPLGSDCLIDDMKALEEAYNLCNRYGMDSISVGSCVAFAMECFEDGIITRSDTGGLDLTWGNGPAMLEIVRQIAVGEGFGRVLSQGVKRAAEQIGGGAERFALHVKGLEPPMHDPRAYSGYMIGYATANRGASHMEQCLYSVMYRKGKPVVEGMGGDTTELGLLPQNLERLGFEGKAALVMRVQDLCAVLDSLTVCTYGFFGYRLKVAQYASWLNAITGWDVDVAEIVRTGERIFNQKRLINLRQGLTAKDDTLPQRFLSRRPEMGEREVLPTSLSDLIQEYYALRGWGRDGVPGQEKLDFLGIEKSPAPIPGTRSD